MSEWRLAAEETTRAGLDSNSNSNSEEQLQRRQTAAASYLTSTRSSNTAKSGRTMRNPPWTGITLDLSWMLMFMSAV